MHRDRLWPQARRRLDGLRSCCSWRRGLRLAGRDRFAPEVEQRVQLQQGRTRVNDAGAFSLAHGSLP